MLNFGYGRDPRHPDPDRRHLGAHQHSAELVGQRQEAPLGGGRRAPPASRVDSLVFHGSARPLVVRGLGRFRFRTDRKRVRGPIPRRVFGRRFHPPRPAHKVGASRLASHTASNRKPQFCNSTAGTARRAFGSRASRRPRAGGERTQARAHAVAKRWQNPRRSTFDQRVARLDTSAPGRSTRATHTIDGSHDVRASQSTDDLACLHHVPRCVDRS